MANLENLERLAQWLEAGAPHNCTPAQAAVAVRRVMDGKEPWS